MAHVGNANAGAENEAKPTTFHDFLGDKGPGQASTPAVVDGEASPSSTSDLGSERNRVDHLEGIPYHGSRFTGYKRSNSDSFMMWSRDKFTQDSPLLTKLLRYSGGEWPRRSSHNEETSTDNKNNNNNNPLKWDRVLQYSQPNTFKKANVGPPLVSQTAVDEGSRTRTKGSGILSSINASGKQKSGIGIFKPDSSTVPNERGNEASGQMTIFYGGQGARHMFFTMLIQIRCYNDVGGIDRGILVDNLKKNRGLSNVFIREKLVATVGSRRSFVRFLSKPAKKILM